MDRHRYTHNTDSDRLTEYVQSYTGTGLLQKSRKKLETEEQPLLVETENSHRSWGEEKNAEVSVQVILAQLNILLESKCL